MKYPLLTSLLFMISVSPLLCIGQGSIAGKITDKKNKESIVGASVYLKGTTIGASTDIDGNYHIKNVVPGTYSIIISFISYKTDTIPGIKVPKDKPVLLNHEITEATTMLTEVSVSARKKTDTELSVIQSLKTSNLILVGVSSQQISRSQDKDASEVIRRLPGVTVIGGRFVVVRGLIERYNSVWLNNTSTPSSETDQRAFSFDVIPSNLINNLMIYKTPAPEIPADFAGAFILIQTKNLPEKNSFGIGYQVGWSQNSSFERFQQYEGGTLDWMGFDDGTRRLPDIVPSTENMKTIQTYNSDPPPTEAEAYKKQLIDISRAFSPTSGTQFITAPLDNKLNLDFSRIWTAGKVKMANITAVAYKLGYTIRDIERNSVESYGSSNTGITYSKLYNDRQHNRAAETGILHNWSLVYRKNTFEFCNLLNQQGVSSTTIRNGTDHYRNDNLVYKTNLAFSGRTVYSGSLSAKHLFRDEKISTLSWQLGYSYANLYEPDNRLITYYASKQSDTSYYPFQLEYSSTVNTDANSRLFSDVKENNYQAGIDFHHNFSIGNFSTELKSGALVEHKQRNFFIRPFGIVWANPTSINNPKILYQPIDSIYTPANFNFTDGIVFKEVFDDSYRYDIHNYLYAGYLSVKLPLTRFLSLYGGVRAEKNSMNLSGPDAAGDFSTKVRRDTLNLFPSANLIVNISDNNLIRLAYGRTINRPEFREIAPFSFYNFQENVVVYGNDSLQSCYIDNYDLRYEWYPSPGEMITVGGFYKSFNHPIEATWIPSSSGEWDLKYLNAINAYSLGVEVDIRKGFQQWGKRSDFLRHFRDFSVVMNASLIQSRVKTDLDFVLDNNRPMYGQSPFIINAGLYYQNPESGWSASLLYNVFGKRIVGIGTPEIPNAYEMPRNILDITLLKKMKNGLTFKLGIKDILNQEVLIRQTMKAEGLPDIDIKVKAFRPGRSISLGISYLF